MAIDKHLDKTPITDPSQAGAAQLDRRRFLGTVAGAAGIGAAVSAGLLTPGEVQARHVARTNSVFPGMRPSFIDKVKTFRDYHGDWTCLGETPFGGFDFALCYMAEGVQGIDPESPNFPNGQLSNTSGLFEQHTLQVDSGLLPMAADTNTKLMPIPSGVGGNEGPLRSSEFWVRDILGQSNAAIRDDLWGAINWHRRVWGLDFDDPAADGINAFGYNYQYPGSPDANNEASLFSPRYAVAFNDQGEVQGFARVALTLLAPDTAYTVVARAGKLHPSYTGGIPVNGTATKTTAASPDWPGKVRDGGVWGGVVEPMDILADIQAVGRGERYFSTPDNPLPPLSGTTPPSPNKRGVWGGTTTNPQGGGPKWGQWWRRVSPIVGLDVDDPHLLNLAPSIDATQDVRTAATMNLYVPFTNQSVPARPAARTAWPIGYWPRGTDFFWGNYNLKFGTEEPTVTLHYQSEVPTAFRPSDGVPEAFPCDLCPNPSSAEINARADMDAGTGIQLFDSSGEVSGFADRSNPELDGQMPASMVGEGQYGRVHGTSYPRSKRKDGAVTYHFRNYLLWPPRLNVTVLGDPTQENFGNINWTIPTLGDFAKANPFPILAFN